MGHTATYTDGLNCVSCPPLLNYLQDNLERIKDFPPIFPVPAGILSVLQGLEVFLEGGKASRALHCEFVLLCCQQIQALADLFLQLYAAYGVRYFVRSDRYRA